MKKVSMGLLIVLGSIAVAATLFARPCSKQSIQSYVLRNQDELTNYARKVIAYLLEEQNTLCTPPVGGNNQSGGNSNSANSASVTSFSFSITPSDSSRRAVSSGIR